MKKLLSCALVLVVGAGLALIPVLAYSAFPDVPEDAPYAYAVNALAGEGVFTGDGAGNFNPSKTMTRAEAAALMVKLFVGGSVPTPTVSSFSDVPVSYWASGYIETAVRYGLITGDGKGYNPGGLLSYNQAVALLVKALGYEDMAQELGGWPEGYVIMAEELGMTQNTENTGSASVPKSTIAVLVYNAWYGGYSSADYEDEYRDDYWDVNYDYWESSIDFDESVSEYNGEVIDEQY